MQLVTALTLANRHAPHIVGSGALAQLLPSEFLAQCLEQAGGHDYSSTAFYRKMDVWSIANTMQLALPGNRVLTAPGAVHQGCQPLGDEAIR